MSKTKIRIDFLWHINYNIIVAQKVGEKMSPKIGRPQVEKPLTIEIKARIDKDTNDKLIKYCKDNNVTRTDVVRKGIQLVLRENK
jgi:hypothetical protein